MPLSNFMGTLDEIESDVLRLVVCNRSLHQCGNVHSYLIRLELLLEKGSLRNFGLGGPAKDYSPRLVQGH